MKIKFQRFFKSYDFHRALLLSISILTTGYALYFLNLTEYIIGVIVGMFLISFCDTQGSFRHRTLSMVLAIVVNFITFLLINLLEYNLGLLFLFIAISTFSISMLAVFGTRGSMFVFACLLSIVLSMIEHYSGIDLLQHAIVLSIGGILYLIISSLFHWFTRKTQINQHLGELAQQTANYLLLRLQAAKDENVESMQIEIMNLQTIIIEKQDVLRELVFYDQEQSNLSNSRNTQILILIELIDIMELAVGNNSIITLAKNNLVAEKAYLIQPSLLALRSIVNNLMNISKSILDNKSITEISSIDEQLEIISYTIKDYISLVGLPRARKGALSLRNLHDYIEKQVSNVNSINRLISSVNRQQTINLSKKTQNRFLPKETYKLEKIIDNLSFKSPIFKHSLRITIAMLIGYSIGLLVGVKNPYWIMLTVLVIMRPNYGLTKKRSLMRLVGTLIGGLVAIAFVLISENFYFHLVMAFLTTIMAYSLLNKNYILATFFITLNIIFGFSLIEPDIWVVIQYRVIDTFIGAGVALFVGYFIIPFWEHTTINLAISNALEKNKNYLLAIKETYLHPEKENIEYRVSRKDSFIATSQLTASFQRLSDDPKSKQVNFSDYYNILVLNQSLLSTLANLGAYIQNHNTANVTREFSVIINKVVKRLEYLKEFIIKDNLGAQQLGDAHLIKAAQVDIENHWDNLEQIRDKELRQGKREIDKHLRLQLQEVRLIKEELNWLIELTENLENYIYKVKKLPN